MAASLGLAVGSGIAAPASAGASGGFWTMDESSGSKMLDSSGNGNDGTTFNVQRTGSGYSFNGVSSKVVVPSSADLNPGARDFSFSVDMQSSVTPARGTDYDLLRKGLTAADGGEYKIEVVATNGQGRAFCLVKDGARVSVRVTGTTNVTDGRPHTITCSRTGSSVTLQVDGLAPRTARASSLGSVSSSRPLTFGVKSANVKGSGGDWYDGLMSGGQVSIGR